MERLPSQWMFAFCVALAAALSGCHTGGGRVVPSPLGYAEQSASILKIAPVGTPHEEAVQSLTAAGIEGTYSRGGNSIYYCDLWQREDGDRWHLNVAVLFDANGRVKATRPAQSEIQTLADEDRHAAQPARSPLPITDDNRKSVQSPGDTPVLEKAAPSDSGTPSRNQRRVPFADSLPNR